MIREVLTGAADQPQSSFREELSNDDYHGLRRKLVEAILALRKALGEGA